MMTTRLCGLALLLCGNALAAPADPLTTLILPAVDVPAVLAADAAQPGPRPFRFAVPIATEISTLTHGQWRSLEDGRMQWSLLLAAPGAVSLNFGFERLVLPAGAELVIADAGGQPQQRYSASPASGQLWTPILPGDSAQLRLKLPAAKRADLALQLSQVGYGFRGFGARDEYSARSGECNIDVVCPDGDEWRDEIRSVARFTISGALLCSGQMMNNTAQDFTPLFLTANHCVTTAAQAPTLVFYWNYETSQCGAAPDGDLSQTSAGAIFLAGSQASTDQGSDFTLVQLAQSPPPEYGVFWSGWDNRDIAPLGVTSIHHPAGDEKRISHFFGQTEITAYLEEPGNADLTGQTDTHLRIENWSRGTTEGGSSGAGIWNNEHRLVGQLSGGYASCSSPTADWYGRMHTNWYGLPTPLTSLANYLDPLGSGAEFLDGADPQAATEPALAVSRALAEVRGGGACGLLLVALIVLRRRRLSAR